MRPPRRLAVALIALVLPLALACGTPPPTEDTTVSSAPSATGGLGTIVFVDVNGCLSRVSAGTGQTVGAPFCAPSRAGVTSVTWLDEGSAAYATAESRALGWQVVDFATGRSERMEMAEAPRVFLIPPQFYSPRGEELEVDAEGVVYRADLAGTVRIFPPESKSPDSTTRLITWSPDADWALLSTSINKELWVVGRNGEDPHRVAVSSKGIASWFMPEAGAMPHADLTCSVTTAASYSCEPALRMPLDGVLLRSAGPGSTLDLSWSACPGATGYEVEIYAGESETPVFRKVSAGTFSHSLLSSLPGGELRWRVRALIGPTPAPWSEERTLTVEGDSSG